MKKSVGDVLREARNKKGLALQQIERQTGIGTHHLLAIELDQFSLIAEDKLDQYLGQYAEIVGVNPEDIKAQLNQQLTEQPGETILDIKTSYDELVVASDPDYVPGSLGSRSSRRSSGQRHHHENKKAIWPLVLLGLLALALVGGVAAVLTGFVKLPTISLPKVAQSSSSSQPSSSEKPTPSSTEPEKPASILAVSGGGDSLDVVVTPDKKPVQIEIKLDGTESWVGLSNSDLGDLGTILNTETPSHTATINEDATEAVLSFGITQGISVTINGEELDMSAITSTSNSVVNLTIK